MTTAAFSPPLRTRRREFGRPPTLPPNRHGLGVALELLWLIYYGLWGLCAQDGTRDRCPCTVPEVVPVYFTNCEIESQPLSGRDSFSAIRGGKSPNHVQFQQLLKICVWIDRPSLEIR